MGRDFSYAFVYDNIPREELNDEEYMENLYFEYVSEFRNYVYYMHSEVFTQAELEEYIECSMHAKNWQEVHALSRVICEWNDAHYVVICSE